MAEWLVFCSTKDQRNAGLNMHRDLIPSIRERGGRGQGRGEGGKGRRAGGGERVQTPIQNLPNSVGRKAAEWLEFCSTKDRRGRGPPPEQ